MTKEAVIHFLRNLMTQGLQKLSHWEQKPPRARKRPWYRPEIHVPPLIVGIISTLIIFIALIYNLEPSTRQILALFTFVIILMSLFVYYLIRDHSDLAKNDDAMALLSVTMIFTLIWVVGLAHGSKRHPTISPYLTPVSFAPLVTALLLHPRLGMVVAFVTALISGIVNYFSLPITLFTTFGGVMAVVAGSRARTSHDISRAGLFVGLIQSVVVLIIAAMLYWDRQTTLVASSSALMSGFLSAFLCNGALPYLENFFSRTSNLRLLTVADVNHPLLKQMSLEAPGTYHHSLIVASMAEDAANAIGANGLLCRVGAYFHDIGKIVKPDYFIENQSALGNPHDQVSPSLSKLVIVSHIKEGLALAQQYKLDQPVLDFIPEHHGTSQIEYFYRKALEMEETQGETEENPVSEEAYRYPGPKPQSKETAIVMLADTVEAASRTLEEPNHQRFQDLTYKLINKKLFDGQLDETPLTLKDLHIIAERFTQTLTTHYHARIPYPEPEATPPEYKEELTP
ncbi:MAG: HDIG domain-containing protein [Elusimicrobia bacterium]|nr:HDIG domain-containing protein [Candidatus Obscuribacterium magneticum]